MITILLAVVLLGFSLADDLTDAQKHELVAATNMFRSQSAHILSGASAMMAVSWNESLAADARKAARQCPQEHFHGIEQGESIAFATPAGSFVFTDLLAFWFYEEGAMFDLRANKCKAGQECGHYRQLMRDKMSSMGCALQTCSGLQILNMNVGDVLLCRYDQAPVRREPTFTVGKQCSACPPGFSCQQNLCVPPGQKLLVAPTAFSSNPTSNPPSSSYPTSNPPSSSYPTSNPPSSSYPTSSPPSSPNPISLSIPTTSPSKPTSSLISPSLPNGTPVDATTSSPSGDPNQVPTPNSSPSMGFADGNDLLGY